MISRITISRSRNVGRFYCLRAAALIAFSLLIIACITVAENLTPSARIAKFSGDRAAAISYTFDDNLRDQFTLAVPMLNEVGFKGTFFVIAGKTAETPAEGEKKEFDPNPHKTWGGICWPELKEMASQGHEIASHTWSHPNLPKMTSEQVNDELSKAYEAIKTRIGRAPLTLAFPYNHSTPEIQTAALKYYVAYRASQMGTGDKSTVASLNAWADKLVEDKKWGIMMTHGIANGYAALSDPEILRTHFKYVKSRESDIWVDTFANVVRYEKERDDAKLSLIGGAGSVTCTLSSSLDPQLYDVPLTLIIEAPGVNSADAKRAGKELPVRIGNGLIYIQASPSVEPIMTTWK